MAIGERIQKIRKTQGGSLRGTAKAADISVAYLSKIEKDESSPTVEVLQKIADALNVPLDEITKVVEAEATPDLPESLSDFIEEYSNKFPELEDSDWQRALVHVRLRGRYPERAEDWLPIFASMRRALGDNP